MTTLTRLKLKAPLLALLLLAVCAAGCGPGFPIMTKEQEDLVTNVTRLVKENESLKARLTAVESQEKGGDIKQSVDALTARLAGLNSDMDKIRQDFAFVQGAVETDDHDKARTKDALAALNAAVIQTNERVASLEKGLRDIEKKTASLTVAIEAANKTPRESPQTPAAQAVTTTPASGLPAATTAAAPGVKTPEDLYAAGYKGVVDKKFDEASDALTSFLAAYPEHKLASNAQYWLGEVYYAKGDYERAVLEFDKVVKKYPKADKTAAAILKEGFSFEKLGSIKEARVLLGNVIEKFPGSPEADIASKRLKTLK
ncbi:MAG: tol-pal system protein YbgF [Deltaproteobacteria bacterium]|nr:tol-pal system protein YbgF [Deltaproteobacteria bacterium]